MNQWIVILELEHGNTEACWPLRGGDNKIIVLAEIHHIFISAYFDSVLGGLDWHWTPGLWLFLFCENFS